jgi:excisionase family DNA binding protein
MPDNLNGDMATTPPPSDAGVTPAEAAVLLGVSERTILRRLKEGELRGEKVNAGRG